MALVITKKTRTILLIVLAVLVVGGGGFLFWRINQEDTVAPEDSEAIDCPDGQVACGTVCCDSDEECEFCGCNKPLGWCGIPNGCDCPTYGECGTRDGQNYSYTTTSWPSGTSFCSSGSPVPASPSFPSVGGTTTWECVANSGDDNCSARRQAIPKYTVKYNANGGKCGGKSILERIVEYKKTSAAPSCTRDGYNVAGFTRTAGGNVGNLNTETGAITNVTGDQTIRVNWSESCGDGTCAADENADNCPADCPAVCGDNYCTHDENADSCSEDCPAECGDNYCTHDEDANSCPEDCPVNCGDDICSEDEDPQNCPEDCDDDCGDGLCTGNENAVSCPADCDDDCGDGICTGNENPETCPADCDDECGDGLCTGNEDSNSCPEDCGEAPIQSGEVPQTGVFDTVLGRVSVGVSFIFLGGLVSQYSRLNYFFNSISKRNDFKREVKRQRRKEERMAKRRKKLEKRFK
jgi:hypothetical protein